MSKKNYNSAHSGTSWPVPYYLDVRVGRHAGRSRGGMTHARYGAWQETTVVFFRLLAPGPSRWSHAQWLHPAAQGGVCGVQSVKTKRSWKIYSAVTFTVGYIHYTALVQPFNMSIVQRTKRPMDKKSRGQNVPRRKKGTRASRKRSRKLVYDWRPLTSKIWVMLSTKPWSKCKLSKMLFVE